MVKTPIFACSTFLLSAAFACAEPLPRAPEGPAESDLRAYFVCSQVATQRVLNFDEATLCGKVYQRIKLSFLPGIYPADFQELAPAERAAVIRVAYGLYLDWCADHAREVEALKEAARSAVVIAAD